MSDVNETKPSEIEQLEKIIDEQNEEIERLNKRIAKYDKGIGLGTLIGDIIFTSPVWIIVLTVILTVVEYISHQY